MAVNPQLKQGSLIPSKAPNLPIAPVEYTQQYQDQVLNALRLYFNQIDNLGQGLTGGLGGSFLYFPFIAAYYYPDQYASADNTATQVLWNGSSGISGFTLNSDNTATASQSGTYKITYSLQFANSDNAAHDNIVWLRVNGADVADSTTIFTTQARKSAGVYGYLCAYSTITFSVNAGDVFALYWATPTAYNTTGPVDGVYMEYVASQASPYARPSIPSAIGAITYMSAPQPPLTRVAPVGIVGVGGVGTPTIVIG